MKISKTLKKSALLLALIFPLVTHSGWASDSDEEGGCCGGSSRTKEKSHLINHEEKKEPGCCYWFWCCLYCGSDDDVQEESQPRYTTHQQRPYTSSTTETSDLQKKKSQTGSSSNHQQPYAVVTPNKTQVQIYSQDGTHTFPLRQEERSPTRTLGHVSRGQQGDGIPVQVSNIVATSDGFNAIVTPITQQKPQPLSLQSSQKQDVSGSDSDESFSEETLTRMRLEENQQRLEQYKKHFELLSQKEYPNEETLRSIHKSQNVSALSRLLFDQTSEGHYLDLTKICQNMGQFFEIPLPQEVIALSSNACDGFMLKGHINQQVISLNSNRLQLEDVEMLQNITQINGKAFVDLMKEFQVRVRFKNMSQ